MDLPMSLPYLRLTAPSWPLETETVSPAAMEERPTWEPEAWGSPGGWLAPREARAGGGVGGAQPLGLVEVLREAGNGG